MTTTFESAERFDLTALRTIVDNWDAIQLPAESRDTWVVNGRQFSPVSILTSYIEKAIPGQAFATAPVEYVSARGQGCGGRQFAKGAQSLQGMARQVRHTISGKFYSDIDMVNAHPVILRQYCESKGWPCPVLASYIDDRDPKLAEIVALNPGCTRDHAKKVVLALMNGGKRDYEALTVKPEWLERFQYEIACVQLTMVADPENAPLVKNVASKKGTAYNNVHGSVCNRVLCALENELLMACVDFVTSKGISTANVVLVFDGFMLPKDAADVDDAFLREMSDYVFIRTKYRVTLSVKAMDDVIDLTGLSPKNPKLVCKSEVHGAELLVEMLRGLVTSSLGDLWALTPARTWSNNPKLVKDVMNRTAMYSNIYKKTSEGVVGFSNTLHGRDALVKLAMPILPEDPTFSDTLFDKSIGKVFFKNGVYDFERRTFRLETDDDMTDRRIPFDFPVRDEAKIKEVRERVLGTIFGNGFDVACYLQHVARAMAGCFEDKHWVVLIGNRNSGKGVLTSMNENAWGPYVRSVQSDSFLMARNTDGGDEAKKLSWLLACTGARIITTQEITVDRENTGKKINGNLIKGKLASGGDRIMARKNYCDEVEFKIQGRLFMALNDMPPVSPADAYETMHMFSFPYQFVEELGPDSMPHMKLGDPSIKAYCREPETVAAFIHLVLDSWIDFPVVKSEAVRIESDLYRREGGDEWSALKDLFEVTRDPKDMVSSASVADVVARAGMNMSKQKTRKRLELLGAKYSEHAIVDGKRVRGYVGLKILDVADV
jgi:hypothetical protein